jgi:hypothetical protein
MRRAWIALSMGVIAACGSKSDPAPAAERGSAHNHHDVAKMTVQKFAFEGFPMWSAAHPDKACPDKLADLSEYVGKGELSDLSDPWGHPYKSFCGQNLPAGARGFAVMSAGEDGTEGTADDVKSWE